MKCEGCGKKINLRRTYWREQKEKGKTRTIPMLFCEKCDFKTTDIRRANKHRKETNHSIRLELPKALVGVLTLSISEDKNLVIRKLPDSPFINIMKDFLRG